MDHNQKYQLYKHRFVNGICLRCGIKKIITYQTGRYSKIIITYSRDNMIYNSSPDCISIYPIDLKIFYELIRKFEDEYFTNNFINKKIAEQIIKATQNIRHISHKLNEIEIESIKSNIFRISDESELFEIPDKLPDPEIEKILFKSAKKTNYYGCK